MANQLPYRFPVSSNEASEHSRYPYVMHHYRVGGTYWDNIKSLFQLHTESVNAWSMILASALSVCGTVYMYVTHPSAFPIFAIFTSSAVIHLPFSVGYHLFTSMDRSTFHKWRQYDVIAMMSVCVLLAYSLGYFVFPPWLCYMNTGYTCVLVIKGVKQFAGLSDEHDLDPLTHSKSLCMIVASYCVPLMYSLIRDLVHLEMHLSTYCTAGISLGLLFSGWAYSSRWPQKLSPGRFDVWGHSHQVMHIGILLCHLFEFMFIYDNYKRSFEYTK